MPLERWSDRVVVVHLADDPSFTDDLMSFDGSIGADLVLDFAGVRHIKVEDGKGRPLGRSYRVKLWPTLIFLKDGKEVERVVRPTDAHSIRNALAQIIPA